MHRPGRELATCAALNGDLSAKVTLLERLYWSARVAVRAEISAAPQESATSIAVAEGPLEGRRHATSTVPEQVIAVEELAQESGTNIAADPAAAHCWSP